jgi:hypothetical protein
MDNHLPVYACGARDERRKPIRLRRESIAIGQFVHKEHSVGASERQQRLRATYDGAASSSDGRSLLRRQLPVIRQMIGDLEVQSVAGQQHTMEKVVAFLRLRIREDANIVTPRNQRELVQMVDQLEREARRQAPDALLFGDRTEALVMLLSATT